MRIGVIDLVRDDSQATHKPEFGLILKSINPVSTASSVKASAHSFKQFTSRLLKLSFSLSMHIYNSDGRHA